MARDTRLEALLRRPAVPLTKLPSREEMVNRYRAQVWMLREALRQAEGYDAASERLRQFVAEIRMVPENGTLSIMVKANAEKLLEAGGLIPSSSVGCGGVQQIVPAALLGGSVNVKTLTFPTEVPDVRLSLG